MAKILILKINPNVINLPKSLHKALDWFKEKEMICHNCGKKIERGDEICLSCVT
jgi:predicted amidophosphoribosyltransferase